MTTNHKFFYIRNESDFPVGCVVYKQYGYAVMWAFSTHNPKDKFDKKIARDVAMGRLTKHYQTIWLKQEHQSHSSDIMLKILQTIGYNKQIFNDLDYSENWKATKMRIPARISHAAKYMVENYRWNNRNIHTILID